MERNGQGDLMDFRRAGKKVIGLTGGISSGKSTVLDMFGGLGAETICADKLGKKYFEILKERIAETFNTADRAKIASLIFKDDAKRKWLENLLHPMIIAEARKLIKNTDKEIIVFDLPLLFEAGLEGGFDLTICVYSDDKTRLARALAKGFDKEDFKRRDLKQYGLERKADKADIVIYNNGDRKTLKEKTVRIFNIIKRNQ